MILIISSKDDRTTNEVIDWLRKYKVKFVRISSDDLVSVSSVYISPHSGINELYFSIRNKKYKLSDFRAVWYRRSWITIQSYLYENSTPELTQEVNKQLYSELNELSKYLIYQLEKKSLNRPNDLFLNKLTVLDECKKIGIEVPSTIITTLKGDLINFYNDKKKIITKNFSQGVFVNFQKVVLNSYTMLVDEDMISDLPESFFPMMFQEYIEKSYEIRAFYLDGKFYCSAILSQNDNQTKVDFRNYNLKKPNRTPPYKLPVDVEKKIGQLMVNLKLNSGSIDLLVDASGKYIFLEVNPIGQFGQVSKPCNYFLEMKVAKHLMTQL